MGSCNGLTKNDYAVLLAMVKYLPIVIHVIIVFNILDGLVWEARVTNWLYPIIGHSVVFDLFLLFFSYKFKFCKWHHILVYDMLINILLEWVSVNFPIDKVVNNVAAMSVAITSICIIAAVCDAILCKKNKLTNKN